MGVGGRGELYPIFVGFLEFFNFATPLKRNGHTFSLANDRGFFELRDK